MVVPTSSETNETSRKSPPNFQEDLVALIPRLRTFSRGLCRRQSMAEDLVQETLAKAWRARDSFQLGTNLKAWLFTILRNEFYTHVRRAKRETYWDSEASERLPAVEHQQDWAMDLSDTARALGELPPNQREALILVSAGGYSYDDVAKICGTPVGTAKSRVGRARATLRSILEGNIPLPRDRSICATNASDSILAQLKALAPIDAASAAFA